MNSPAMQRMFGTLHYLTAVFAVFVPLAAALYLTVTVVWTLVQRMLLRRRYPLPVVQTTQPRSKTGSSPSGSTSGSKASGSSKKASVSPAAGSVR
jgi:YidC/Oxa1 family membrane protein insertase